MKKAYETPSVEVVEFKYRDQVVVASGRCVVDGSYSHYVDECDSSQSSSNRNN